MEPTRLQTPSTIWSDRRSRWEIRYVECQDYESENVINLGLQVSVQNGIEQTGGQAYRYVANCLQVSSTGGDKRLKNILSKKIECAHQVQHSYTDSKIFRKFAFRPDSGFFSLIIGGKDQGMIKDGAQYACSESKLFSIFLLFKKSNSLFILLI